MDYLKARLSEKDTHTVIAASIWAIVRAFIPPQYVILADTIAGALGVAVAATPNR